MDKVAFAVLSCDPYSDLWEVYGLTFQKFWPDCPYDRFMVSHYKSFKKNGFEPILLGADTSWSHGLIVLIEELQNRGYQYAFIAFDDLMLKRKVDADYVKTSVDSLISENGSCLRFVPEKTPRGYRYNELYDKMYKDVPYRVTLGFTLWSLKALRNLVIEGETAWEFEKNTSKRSQCDDLYFVSKKSPFKFINLVIKRKLDIPAYKRLQRIIPDIVIGREKTIVIKEKLMGVALYAFLHYLPHSWQLTLYNRFSKPLKIR